MTDQKPNESEQHPIFRDLPPPEAVLWRYMSFAKLSSLLRPDGTLHFTRIDSFDDHFEGIWPKSDLAEWAKFGGLGPTIEAFTDDMKRRVAASCWIDSANESAAMWGLYAPGNEGVAVRTSCAKLTKVTQQWQTLAPGTLAGVSRVRYVDHLTASVISELKPGEPLPNALLPFMLKNVSYSHEREVRALAIGSHDVEFARSGGDVPIQSANFVEEVVINPLAQDWFEDTVRRLCGDTCGAPVRRSTLDRRLAYGRPPVRVFLAPASAQSRK